MGRVWTRLDIYGQPVDSAPCFSAAFDQSGSDVPLMSVNDTPLFFPGRMIFMIEWTMILVRVAPVTVSHPAILPECHLNAWSHGTHDSDHFHWIVVLSEPYLHERRTIFEWENMQLKSQHPFSLGKPVQSAVFSNSFYAAQEKRIFANQPKHSQLCFSFPL